jgi:hypothetical protein
MKRYTSIIGFALLHFLISLWAAYAVFRSFFFHSTPGEEYVTPSYLTIAKFFNEVFLFPLVSLDLIPHSLFPGDWYLIVIFINSLLWSLTAYVIFMFIYRRKNTYNQALKRTE